MSGLMGLYKSSVPIRVRMFLERLGLILLAWLATAGAIDMFRNASSRPSAFILCVLVIACAVGAVFRPLPNI